MRRLMLLVATTAAIAVLAVVGLDAQNPAVANPNHSDGGFRACGTGNSVWVRAKTVGQTRVSARYSTYNMMETKAQYGTDQEVRIYHFRVGLHRAYWDVSVNGWATNGPRHYVAQQGTYSYCVEG